MGEGEGEAVDALRARHPGWRITRPEYFGRVFWEASCPGALLLRREAGELDEAVCAVKRSWQQAGRRPRS